jgi:hypothetical protein
MASTDPQTMSRRKSVVNFPIQNQLFASECPALRVAGLHLSKTGAEHLERLGKGVGLSMKKLDKNPQKWNKNGQE